MNNSMTGFVGVCAGVVTILALGMGPLNPPAGPVSSTGVTLNDIYNQLPAGQSTAILTPAGLEPGTMTSSPQLLHTGSGTIRKIIVNANSATANGVINLFVDDVYAGSFRPAGGVASVGVVLNQEFFNLNLSFGSSIKASVTNGIQNGDTVSKYSVCVYFE